MTQEERIVALATQIGADIKGLVAVDATKAPTSYVDTAIANLRTELRGGAGAALDTFKEVQDQLALDETATAALATAVGNRVRFDAAQTLTTAQQAQACANIGIGNPDRDFLAVYTAAKA